MAGGWCRCELCMIGQEVDTGWTAVAELQRLEATAQTCGCVRTSRPRWQCTSRVSGRVWYIMCYFLILLMRRRLDAFCKPSG